MARSKGRVCYYCGQEATGQEHVPPGQMFKGFDCDSITVPSCEAHNASKCGDDQTIIDLLMRGVDWQRTRAPISQDAQEALLLRSSSFSYTKHRIDHAKLVDHPMLPEIPYLEPETDIHGWMQHVVAGLVFDGVGFHDASVDWSTAFVFSPGFVRREKIPTLSPKECTEWLNEIVEMADGADRSFEWFEGWSGQPRPYPRDVFFFRVGFHDEGFVCVRLQFYGDSQWYVVAGVSDRTRRALRDRLAKV